MGVITSRMWAGGPIPTSDDGELDIIQPSDITLNKYLVISLGATFTALKPKVGDLRIQDIDDTDNSDYIQFQVDDGLGFVGIISPNLYKFLNDMMIVPSAGGAAALTVRDTGDSVDRIILNENGTITAILLALGTLDLTPPSDIDALDIIGTNLVTAAAIDIDLPAKTSGDVIQIDLDTSQIEGSGSLIDILDQRNHDDLAADIHAGIAVDLAGNFPGTFASRASAISGVISGAVGASGALAAASAISGDTSGAILTAGALLAGQFRDGQSVLGLCDRVAAIDADIGAGIIGIDLDARTTPHTATGNGTVVNHLVTSSAIVSQVLDYRDYLLSGNLGAGQVVSGLFSRLEMDGTLAAGADAKAIYGRIYHDGGDTGLAGATSQGVEGVVGVRSDTAGQLTIRGGHFRTYIDTDALAAAAVLTNIGCECSPRIAYVGGTEGALRNGSVIIGNRIWMAAYWSAATAANRAYAVGQLIYNECNQAYQVLDAALMVSGTPGGPGYTYGIDLGPAGGSLPGAPAIATADIRGHSGDTLNNGAAGTWTVSNGLFVTGVLDWSTVPAKPKIYSQTTEPNIPNDTWAFWVDTDAGPAYWLILDVGGTQVKVQLT